MAISSRREREALQKIAARLDKISAKLDRLLAMQEGNIPKPLDADPYYRARREAKFGIDEPPANEALGG
jgi:hypothetical protein